MNYKADFFEGQVLFTEAKPPNLGHLQAAMFLDRPDLWPVKRRRRNFIPPPEQQPLFKEGD